MATVPTPIQLQPQLNVERGAIRSESLQYSAPISANVLYDMVAGQVGHLNSSGEIEPGCYRWNMPLYLFQGAADYDVNHSNNGEWFPIMPGGKVMCLVGKGPWQLSTTQFDPDATFAVGDALRAPIGLTALDEGISGTLTNHGVFAISATIASSSDKYTNICGIYIASSTNVFNQDVISFWPVWYPGHTTEAGAY